MTQLMRISIVSIGVIAAARAVPDGQTPTPTGTSRRPGCRVYPTSVTETTTDSTGGRTILAYTARFDPKTLETTQDVTYSSTQGSRFTYRQRTIYASLTDFIREGSLAPPFPLYRSTVQTGGINMTVQVTYDKSEHQLQTVTSQQAGQQAITNTAWDKAGRPTAGTISGPSRYASTFTYAYDDKQRTQTHTVVTGPQTMVMTTTFDADANPISRVTRGGNQSSTTTIEIHSRETQCLTGQPPPSPAGTGTPSPGIPSNGSVTANIGGRSFTSAVGVKGGLIDAKQPDGRIAKIVSVGAGDQNFLLSLSVTVTDGPGTYDVELKMDPDPKKSPRGTATATLFENSTRAAWAANVAGGRGTITVSSLTASGASGSFNLVLDPTPGTPASGSRPVSGTFTISF